MNSVPNNVNRQEENNQTPLLSRTINIFGQRMPFWSLALCLILFIIFVIYFLWDNNECKIVKPNFEITVPSESPRLTVIDDILAGKRRY